MSREQVGPTTGGGLFFAGLFIAIGLIITMWLAGGTIENVTVRDNTISVKGYAEQPIKADFGIWRARITTRGPELTATAERLARQRQQVLAFLTQNGAFQTSDISISAVDINVVYARDKDGKRTNTIERFDLSQGFEARSPDVTRVSQAAVASGDLLQQGVEISVNPPEYLFTKLDGMKLEMLERATANARQRVDKLLSASDVKVGKLRSASQGVFQITPAYSTDVSNYGINDTTTIDKTIKAVVTIEYAIE